MSMPLFREKTKLPLGRAPALLPVSQLGIAATATVRMIAPALGLSDLSEVSGAPFTWERAPRNVERALRKVDRA